MNTIDLTQQHKNIYNIALAQNNTNSSDNIEFTNYYLTLNQKPLFGISAEFHFSRYDEAKWEDELIKIKMSGVNILATYVIWNHHEETKGTYLWDDHLDLNKFVRLCAKHQLFVILRIGPFCHGEIRNGGLPDWLFGEPCQIRSNDKNYLRLVDILYGEIGKQVTDLFFKDGGPIIGVQLENEFGHASAPWELTTGTSNEWCSIGTDGHDHIRQLKSIAHTHKIIPAFYTGTGWGGAFADPEIVLPLWGGYAYWPWIFYGDVQEHPLTPEYIYRDFHNNNIPETYNFTPLYPPESVPYACCEMGGGMTVFYNYRFRLPYKSIDAMSNIKIAGGCNFIGYYVYHGGSNPTGKNTPFMNEAVTPKISYDYQAVISEFGQTRPSYQRLKRLHYFLNEFSELLCPMKTILPDNSQDISPNDLNTIRYAVRVADNSGFVFINNFQDHIDNKDTDEFNINLKLEHEEINLTSLSLKKEESCVLPFNFKMGAAILKYSTTQLITRVVRDNIVKYIFFTPDGMPGDYFFEAQSLHPDMAENNIHVDSLVKIPAQPRLKLKDKNGVNFEIFTLTASESEKIWCFDFQGEQEIVLTAETLLVSSGKFKIESEHECITLELIKGLHSSKIEEMFVKHSIPTQCGHVKKYTLHQNKAQCPIEYTFINNQRGCLIDISSETLNSVKDVLLSLEYDGDIGYCFIDNQLIHDNYNNNDPWVIGLSQYRDRGCKLYIKISPRKENSVVKSDSPMAARSESNENEIARINKITLTPIYEFTL